MVSNIGAGSVEPVANPGLRERKRHRLIRMTKEQVTGRTGPVRQIRHRDEVVSPLALEAGCRQLLRRAQRSVTVVLRSEAWAGDLRGTVGEAVLRQHEWEIAVSLREITELLLDLVSSAGGRGPGPAVSVTGSASTRRGGPRW